MYLTFTRRGMAAATAVLLLIIAIFSEFSAVGAVPENGGTNAKRNSFISSLGLDVVEECIDTAQIKLPARFGEVYSRYNELQLSAGYDLRPFAGCTVTRYTYQLKAHPERHVNLLVYKGRIIGGDISDVALGGDMLALKRG